MPKEAHMIEVSEMASQKVGEYISTNDLDSFIRIYLNEGGWGGPSLGLALDELKDTDKTFKQDGITFMIDEDLLERVGNIHVDFIDAGMRSGFSLTPGKPLATGPNACDGNCC